MKSLLAAFFLFSAKAFAAGGGHQEGGIPWTLIYTQIFNLVLVVGFLLWVLRKPTKEYFANRRAQYRENFVRAEKFMNEAKNKNQDIKERLRNLEGGQEAQFAKAKSEAAELSSKLKSEAQALAARMEKDSGQIILFEKERAVEELRTELLDQAIHQAEETLKTTVKSTDQKRLQSEFFQKIQVLQ